MTLTPVVDISFQFKTKGGPQLKEYCAALTKEDCRHKSGSYIACEKVCPLLISLRLDLCACNELIETHNEQGKNIT